MLYSYGHTQTTPRARASLEVASRLQADQFLIQNSNDSTSSEVEFRRKRHAVHAAFYGS